METDRPSTADALHHDYVESAEALAPADAFDPVIEAYKKDVDRTLLWETLRMTVDERARNMQSAIRSLEKLRGLAARDTGKVRAQTEVPT